MTNGTRRGWGVSVTPRLLFTPGKTRYPLYRQLGGPQGRSGQVQKISPPTGIRSPDRPACSQLLYWLSYLAHIKHKKTYKTLWRTLYTTRKCKKANKYSSSSALPLVVTCQFVTTVHTDHSASVVVKQMTRKYQLHTQLKSDVIS
jgi:hypothetical protein